jgi:hypothetical protein
MVLANWKWPATRMAPKPMAQNRPVPRFFIAESGVETWNPSLDEIVMSRVQRRHRSSTWRRREEVRKKVRINWDIKFSGRTYTAAKGLESMKGPCDMGLDLG